MTHDTSTRSSNQEDTNDASQEVDPGTAFLFEAFEPANRENPYPLYQRMRHKHAILNGGNGIWITFTHDAAHTLLRARGTSSDERKSSEHQRLALTDPGYRRREEEEPLMLFTDPPDHTRLRSLIGRAFTPRTVERLRPRLEALAIELLDSIDGAGPIDFVERVAYPFPVAVICELLGVPIEDASIFQAMSEDLTLMIEPGVLRTDEQEAAIDRASADLGAYISTLLDERRADPGDDLISGLLAARDGEDRLSEPELINMVILLLLAGHETTVNLLGNSLVALLRNPDQLALWQADPTIAHRAIDELVRYDSPVQMGMRVTLEETEVGGVMVPAAEQIICLLGAANRDPSEFRDPDRLDLTRENAGANMSFGGGIHHCIGMALARTEAEVLLGQLVARFNEIDLLEEPEHRARFVLRGYEKIMISAAS